MGFLETLREWDDRLSEPAFFIQVTTIEDDNERLLLEENHRLKQLLQEKQVKAIETTCKLLG